MCCRRPNEKLYLAFFCGSRTTGTLEDVRRLGDLPENMKTHREPFLHEIPSMTDSKTANVLYIFMKDEMEHFSKNGLQFLSKL